MVVLQVRQQKFHLIDLDSLPDKYCLTFSKTDTWQDVIAKVADLTGIESELLTFWTMQPAVQHLKSSSNAAEFGMAFWPQVQCLCFHGTLLLRLLLISVLLQHALRDVQSVLGVCLVPLSSRRCRTPLYCSALDSSMASSGICCRCRVAGLLASSTKIVNRSPFHFDFETLLHPHGAHVPLLALRICLLQLGFQSVC